MLRRNATVTKRGLRITDGATFCPLGGWGLEKKSVRVVGETEGTLIHGNGYKHRSRWISVIRQDLPTASRHPLASQDLPSHPTQREEEVKERGEGEKEKEKTGHRCEACHTQSHGQGEKTIEKDGDGDGWLWCKWTRLEGQVPSHCWARLLCQSQAEQD